MAFREDFRDKARDKICNSLQVLGIDAQMAERGRPEEKIGGKDSLGLIDIPEGPISWVNVRKEYSGGESGSTDYYTDYGVPDPRLGTNFKGAVIFTHRKKKFPLFGKVVDLYWEGNDFSDLGIIDRMNSDISIKHPIMETRDVEIWPHDDHGCWIISVESKEPPSEELWNCYQTIAKHLLA